MFNFSVYITNLIISGTLLFELYKTRYIVVKVEKAKNNYLIITKKKTIFKN